MEGCSPQVKGPGAVAAEVGELVECEPGEVEETVEGGEVGVPAGHLVRALLGNLVDGPEVAEAGEFVDR